MAFHRRGIIITRSFKLIKALIKKPHTSMEIAELLGVNRSNAYYYIREASIEFPIMETNDETRKGKEAIKYYLPPESLFGRQFLINLKTT